ncbi:PadR family transcriptional regulator [Halobacteria archaeon AArc-m2/3/4]|uniref:PadR family transcriptional regulator n=1 Tax=Natronoglomus mannanivorans TaxID=2979990 RepID=A0AAP3E2T5_9EURY|nr:PadR family transcriptional regulator [Halobacteria archaeon AArc-xg1-1]MCU4974224.1 PadR family transcriptional regulator [Halobacteria archaeon AArc-m2/3/4]
MHDLTGFQRDLMFVIAGMESPNGQEIKQELENSQGREILHGRLYANLDTLVEEGFVTKGELDGRTNRYSISERGRHAIAARYDWQTEYVAPDATPAKL